MTVGHESAGLVEEVGAGATVAVGDRVAVYNKIFCGACEQCLAGRQNICDNEPGQFGFNLDGGYAEYLNAPSRNLRGSARPGRLRNRLGARMRGNDCGSCRPAVEYRGG